MFYISQKQNIPRGSFTRGFTLIEMLVSIAVFMVVMLVAVGSLASVIDANKKAQTIKSSVNNVNFVMESMSKLIRTGIMYKCYSSNLPSQSYSGDSFLSANCHADGDIAIRFLSQDNEWVTYRYRLLAPSATGVDDDGVIERCKEDNDASQGECAMNNDANYVRMTSPQVKIIKSNFYVVGANSGDLFQPRVLITLSGSAGTEAKTKTKFDLQTSVTQRIIDL